MPFMKINGQDLYYEDHGQGDPVMLLHHGFGCIKIWKNIYPALIEAGYRIVMYDRRGYGRSEKGTDFPDFYTSDQFRAECVKDLAVLVDCLELETFHVIGQCEGGVVAVDYAGAYPEKVKTVTISSTQCFSDVPMTVLNREKFPKAFRDLEPELREKLIDWHGEQYAQPFFDQFRLFGGAYGKDFFDLRPQLPAINCPFLILYPDRSAIFDVEQGLDFYRNLPKGELAVLPKCGHNTYEHYPEEYVRMVLQFLKRNGW